MDSWGLSIDYARLSLDHPGCALDRDVSMQRQEHSPAIIELTRDMRIRLWEQYRPMLTLHV